MHAEGRVQPRPESILVHVGRWGEDLPEQRTQGGRAGLDAQRLCVLPGESVKGMTCQPSWALAICWCPVGFHCAFTAPCTHLLCCVLTHSVSGVHTGNTQWDVWEMLVVCTAVPSFLETCEFTRPCW